MSKPQRTRFTTRVDSVLLAELRALAQVEGRSLQSLVEEAMANLIERRNPSKGRLHVTAAYNTVVERYAPLFEQVSKLE